MCGPATMPITRASTLKCPSASISCAATFSWPAVSGREASSVERVSLVASGQLPDEVGGVGDVRAVAALRGQLLLRDRLGRPARDAGLVLDRILGEARQLGDGLGRGSGSARLGPPVGAGTSAP